MVTAVLDKTYGSVRLRINDMPAPVKPLREAKAGAGLSNDSFGEDEEEADCVY
jgi:hypothetical protein